MAAVARPCGAMINEMREELREAIFGEKLAMLAQYGCDFSRTASIPETDQLSEARRHFCQCGDHKEKNIVRNILASKDPGRMVVNRRSLLIVAKHYNRFARFLPALLGDYDPQNSALMHDLCQDQSFTNALYLNGFRRDALVLWVLGRAFEAANQRGLSVAYRQLCFDRLDFMIRCMFGRDMWLVGHLGSATGGKLRYGLAKAHVGGFPREGLLALVFRDSVRNQLRGESIGLVERVLTQLDLESANNLFAVSRSSGYRHSMREMRSDVSILLVISSHLQSFAVICSHSLSFAFV
eukprot:SAG31_NODE_3408_length_4306_cov_17.408129_1_plen_295_part_00